MLREHSLFDSFSFLCVCQSLSLSPSSSLLLRPSHFFYLHYPHPVSFIALSPYPPRYNLVVEEDDKKPIKQTNNMKIPGIKDKRLQTPEERRDITDAFLNIHYPCDSWTRVYTDGSAEDAVRNGWAGVCVQHSVDDEEHVSIPTGLHSTNYNYKAEAMALEEAATILERSERTKNNVVYLTDALSVLQSIKSNKDKNIACLQS